MHQIFFYNKKRKLIGTHEVDPDIFWEEELSKIGVCKGYVFIKNGIDKLPSSSEDEEWINITTQDDYKEQFYKSYLQTGKYEIKLVILNSKPSKIEDKCKERLEKLLKNLNRFQFKYCIIEILNNFEYIYELFCNFNPDIKDIQSLSNDEIYYLSNYYLFQSFKCRRRVFIELKRETDPLFNEHDIDKRNIINNVKILGEILCNGQEKHPRGFGILGIYYRGPVKNFELMTHYYSEAINRGDYLNSGLALANYYKNNSKDYKNAVELYKLIASKGSFKAINSLGVLYSEEIPNEKLMLKYFRM